MYVNNRLNKSQSDDEDDLEALRLAALQTLKKKSDEYDSVLPNSTHGSNCGFINVSKGIRKRGRYFTPQTRNCKNVQYSKGQYNNRSSGQFNSRARNTNLISITPVQTSDDALPSKQVTGRTPDPPKLILPQDRYNKSIVELEKSEGPVSKFDRYNNSESESEDEDEVQEPEPLAQSNVKRSDSLEELMKELEDEIQGDTKPKELPKDTKPKTKVKRKRSANLEASSEVVSASSKDKESGVVEKRSTAIHTEPEIIIDKEIEPVEGTEKSKSIIHKQEENEVNVVKVQNEPVNRSPSKNNSDAENKMYSPSKSKHRIRSPSHRKTDYHRKSMMNYPKSQQPLPFSQTVLPQNPVFTPQTPVFLPFSNPVPVINPAFNLTNFLPNVPPPSPIPQPSFIQSHTPLSPLTINTDTINTAITAPLSPRSAAFVMENRAIIEKRKRSPRRSYSRSPSPRSRHSSPRRSFTPKRGSLSPPRIHRRSLTPKKGSISPRRYSPRRRSRSPRRSLSPVRRNSPLPRRYSPKRPRAQCPSTVRGSVYDRLGVKVGNSKTESDTPETRERERIPRRSRSRSGTPLRDEKPEKLEVIDPVLEARRRKFETNEIKNKDGIIRLKPKEEDKAKVYEKNAEENKLEHQEKDTSCKMETTSNKVDMIDKVSNTSNSLDDNRTMKDDVDRSGITIEEKLMAESKDDTEKIDDLSDLNEEELLAFDETLDLSPPVARLLSDEESDDENEGRFKAKTRPEIKVPILPFTKLVNGTRSELKENVKVTKSVPNFKKDLSKPREDKRKRSMSPVSDRKSCSQKPDSAPSMSSKVVSADVKHEAKRHRFSGRLQVSNKTTTKVDKPPITTPIENKRIEIKIKHPSKYKKADTEEKELDKKRNDDKCVYTSRKVEITKRDLNSSESETEILVENEDNTLTVENRHSDGDLRAQLSRKRAQRQNRPESERSSRLLHNALDEAVFKKSKKNKKEKEAKKEHQALRRLLKLEKLKRNMSRAIKLNDKLHVYEHIELCYDPDVRLPIHMRLGMANSAELFPVAKKKKSSKKHRKRALEQVLEGHISS